jgi:hypothetical protein
VSESFNSERVEQDELVRVTNDNFATLSEMPEEYAVGVLCHLQQARTST